MNGAPLAWLREAFERRDILAAQGVPLIVTVDAWGVTIAARGLEAAVGRAWPMLEEARTNPLIPTIDTIVTKWRRKT